MFRPDGTITAGNASPLNDGASAVLLGSETAADRIGSPPVARIAGRGAYALDPQLFGYAPVEAAEQALRRAGIGWTDVGAVELNEAFAVQSLACIDAWGIDPEIVNVHGGAIAIGHPLGASGGRLLGTLVKVLQERRERWGVAALCIGVGQALAVVVENDLRWVVMRTFITDDADAAVAGIADGSTILIGGFGMAGMPVTLIDALIRQGAKDLTVVNNNAGNGDTGLAALLAAGQVRKMICSFPRQSDSYVFDGLYRGREDRARAGPAGQSRRADARGRRRHRRVLLPDRGRHSAGGGKGDKARSTGGTTCWSIRSRVMSR